MPLRAERAEVLARGSGSRLVYPRSGEMITERVDDASTRVGIVRDERVPIERRDLRRLGRTRRGGLGVDDALDRREHALAHTLVERTHVHLDDRLVGNYVLLGACLKRSDRDDRRVGGREFARDDRL